MKISYLVELSSRDKVLFFIFYGNNLQEITEQINKTKEHLIEKNILIDKIDMERIR